MLFDENMNWDDEQCRRQQASIHRAVIASRSGDVTLSLLHLFTFDGLLSKTRIRKRCQLTDKKKKIRE